MKKTTCILLAALACIPAAGFGQNIALGERAPEPKVQTWLAGHRPADAPMTYVEFFHSASRNSLAAVEHLQALSARADGRLRVVVVVHEPEEKVAPLLTPYLSERLGAGLDPAGRLFAAYDVSYVPFGVLLGPRSRVLWMGNTLQLTPEIIEQSK